jgi:hypothetical protein
MSNEAEKQPVVKPVPTFKVGETVIHKDTGDKHKVIGITPDKKLLLQGVAGHLEPAAFEEDA